MEDTNRKAILIYLRNLVILETMRYKTAERLSRMQRMQEIIENTKVENYVPKKKSTSVIGIYLIDCGGIYWLILSAVACAIGGFLSFLFGGTGLFRIAVIIVIILNSLLLLLSIGSARDNKRANAQSLLDAEQKNRLAVERYNEQQQKLGGIISVVRQLNEESQEIAALLKSEYSTNLIPKQFRTIEGIYYLYEYMSTSTQSLRDALLHANLNEIKDRLDEIIEQHEQTLQLLQKEIRNIVRQNTEILQQAKAAAQSAQDAAMYQQITADNSRLSLMLQREQLAYQRAEFFLR